MEWLKISIDYGVIGLLIALSIISLGIVIERYLLFKKISIADFPDRRTLELLLTSRLHVVATIGSNSPYIGLLGTVLGIMLVFYTLGREGQIDSGKIMMGLSLALKATAIGLLVAIPSIMSYNFLLRRVKVMLMEWDIRHDGR